MEILNDVSTYITDFGGYTLARYLNRKKEIRIGVIDNRTNKHVHTLPLGVTYVVGMYYTLNIHILFIKYKTHNVIRHYDLKWNMLKEIGITFMLDIDAFVIENTAIYILHSGSYGTVSIKDNIISNKPEYMPVSRDTILLQIYVRDDMVLLLTNRNRKDTLYLTGSKEAISRVKKSNLLGVHNGNRLKQLSISDTYDRYVPLWK